MNSDTEMGSPGPSFPTTRPSFVARLASPAADERARAAEVLVRSYWKPVYKYLRLCFRKGNEDAKDLTQAFLTGALEKDWPARFDARRGRFRSFVRLALDGFVSNAEEAARRDKRGGGATPLRLDFDAAEGELAGLEPPAPESLDEWFEREWRRELFAATLAALELAIMGPPDRAHPAAAHALLERVATAGHVRRRGQGGEPAQSLVRGRLHGAPVPSRACSASRNSSSSFVSSRRRSSSSRRNSRRAAASSLVTVETSIPSWPASSAYVGRGATASSARS